MAVGRVLVFGGGRGASAGYGIPVLGSSRIFATGFGSRARIRRGWFSRFE